MLRGTDWRGAATALAGCLLFMLLALLVPHVLGMALALPPGRHVVIWPRPVGSLAVALAGLPLCFLAWRLTGRLIRSRTRFSTALYVLAPLSFLPLAVYGLFLRRFVPPFIAGNLLFLVPVVLLSLVLARFFEIRDRAGQDRPVGRRTVWIWGLSMALFYAAVGWYFTSAVGPHSGDEGHYIMLADSLCYDHDLDIYNNVRGIPEHSHVSPLARDGRWFSWHPFGLPLLLAPVVPGGAIARHAVLGLLAGLACAGMVQLCRVVKAGAAWTLLTAALFSLSPFWGIYSSRCLPEVGGATLTVWAVVALLKQREWQWGSVLLGVACCGYLPWMHTRFIPVSLTVAGLYGLVGLMESEPWKRKAARLGSFAALCVAAYGFFHVYQSTMFEGGIPYPVRRLLFSYPPGMWLSLASDRGIVAALPMFAWLLAATLWLFAADAARRKAMGVVLLLLLTVLVTSSATRVFTGGACVPGRFLVVVAPLLVAGGACALGRTSGVARWWLIFLGLTACAQFALMLLRLPEFQKSFIDPVRSLRYVYPLLDGLMSPLWPPFGNGWHPFAVLLLAGTFALIALGASRLSGVMLAGIMAGAVLTITPERARTPPQADAPRNANRLAELGDKFDGAWVEAWGERGPEDLFKFVNRRDRTIAAVTTQDLGVGVKDRTVSLPQLPTNDWAGRDYRWATLVSPFSAGAGWRVCRLTGRLEGDATAFWALREGSQTLLEQRLEPAPDHAIRALSKVRCAGKGSVHILLRLEGDDARLGRLSVEWAPFSERLLSAAGLVAEP